MPLTIKSFDLHNVRLKKEFVVFPWQIYQHDVAWVPPLIKERMDFLAPSNPYFEHAKVKFWLAYKGNQIVGRISAQVDQLATPVETGAVGFFGMFECDDDQAVADALLNEAEKWLHSQGCKVVRGPFNLSVNQESGLLIDGFTTPPFFMMGHAMPYYEQLLLAGHYKKAKDLYAWFDQTDFNHPPAMKRVIERYDDKITLRDFDLKNTRQELLMICNLFNEAWENNWGFIPITENEFLHMGKEMLQIIPANYFKIAEIDGQPAGFIVMMPNLNESIKDLNGKLFPTGLFKLLWRLKFSRPKSVRVPLMGIKQKYQNQLIGSALAFLLIGKVKEVALSEGIRTHEMSWVLEDNTRLNKILASLGGQKYKTYRIYEKVLSEQYD
jgi:GNAT superfamily N-acetyltransferase